MHKQIKNKQEPVLYLYLIGQTTNNSSPIKVKNHISIGQSSLNNVQMTCSGVSKYHVRIERRDHNFVIRDLKSHSGTYLNGIHINEAYLCEGDYLKIGSQELRVSFCHTNVNKDEYLNNLQSRNNAWNQELRCLPYYSKKDLPVLLLGESGVGKEVIARYIHENSPRRSGRFVAVNCSSLRDSLIESELFGHVKGSFTGAISDRKGAFEAARRGTLFLDEIGDLAIHLQPKLLRAIENKEVRPVGSDCTIRTDVRIIAATHRDLKSLVTEKKFRSDLLFRLNVVQIKIPALRERMEDFEMFLSKLSKEMEVQFPQPVVEEIKKYNWPGNIRELRNFVARASAVCKNKVVIEDLPRLMNTISFHSLNHLETSNNTMAKLFANHCVSSFTDHNKNGSILKELEKAAMKEALLKYQGNQSLASRFLGISKSTFHTRLKKHQIDISKIIENTQKS